MNLTSVDVNLIAWRYCDQLSSGHVGIRVVYPIYIPEKAAIITKK